MTKVLKVKSIFEVYKVKKLLMLICMLVSVFANACNQNHKQLFQLKAKILPQMDNVQVEIII